MGYGDEDEIIQEPNNGEVQEPNNGGMSFEAADGDQEPRLDRDGFSGDARDVR